MCTMCPHWSLYSVLLLRTKNSDRFGVQSTHTKSPQTTRTIDDEYYKEKYVWHIICNHSSAIRRRVRIICDWNCIVDVFTCPPDACLCFIVFGLCNVMGICARQRKTAMQTAYKDDVENNDDDNDNGIGACCSSNTDMKHRMRTWTSRCSHLSDCLCALLGVLMGVSLSGSLCGTLSP